MCVFLDRRPEFLMTLKTCFLAVHLFCQLVIGVAVMHGVARHAGQRTALVARRLDDPQVFAATHTAGTVIPVVRSDAVVSSTAVELPRRWKAHAIGPSRPRRGTSNHAPERASGGTTLPRLAIKTECAPRGTRLHNSADIRVMHVASQIILHAARVVVDRHDVTRMFATMKQVVLLSMIQLTIAGCGGSSPTLGPSISPQQQALASEAMNLSFPASTQFLSYQHDEGMDDAIFLKIKTPTADLNQLLSQKGLSSADWSNQDRTVHDMKGALEWTPSNSLLKNW